MLRGSVSKPKRLGLAFPETVNVGYSFAAADLAVVASVKAAVIERVIRRVGGRGSTEKVHC